MQVPEGIRTTVFTVADRPYEIYVLPYIASVLHHNSDVVVELCLEDVDRFVEENKTALEIISERYGADRFLFRGSNFKDWLPVSMRFLEEPYMKAEYTYIAEVDMIIVESITDYHIQFMEKTGLPYSNCRQDKKVPHRIQLSGRHFTRTDAYYPVEVPKDAPLTLDRVLLARLVQAKGHQLVDSHVANNIHGYHYTPNRLPSTPSLMELPDWGSIGTKSFLAAYRRLSEEPTWQEIYPLFDSAVRLKLTLLNTSLRLLFPEEFDTD